MSKLHNKELKLTLARNIVRFESFDTDKEFVCRITIGGIEKLRKYTLERLKKEVLHEMAASFWGIDENIMRMN